MTIQSVIIPSLFQKCHDLPLLTLHPSSSSYPPPPPPPSPAPLTHYCLTLPLILQVNIVERPSVEQVMDKAFFRSVSRGNL